MQEVGRYLEGIDLEGHAVLDIGCGLGGVDVHLVKNHGAAMVTGIDVDAGLIERCNLLAQKYDIQTLTEFIHVEPGPLGFGDASFGSVTSKDSIIHIAAKQALADDVYRVLKPGGWFVASDWLAGYEGLTSKIGTGLLEHEIDVWDRMIVVIDQGQLRPTHLRGRKTEE